MAMRTGASAGVGGGGVMTITPGIAAQNVQAYQNAYHAQLSQTINGVNIATLAARHTATPRTAPNTAVRPQPSIMINGRKMTAPSAAPAATAAPVAATPQKRKYTTTAQRQAAAATAGSSGNIASPSYKYSRTQNGRTLTNNCKNHLHATDAAAKYKAAYNNAGPAIVNLVENAAAYFEGKDTPEAIRDKERSYERYTFNAEMLGEIFEGPLPSSAPVEARSKLRARQRESRDAVLKRVGARMAARTHVERMQELDAFRKRYEALEGEYRGAEKGCMRLFQKLDRATSTDELRKLRAEYELLHGVKFVDFPAPMVKRELDRSLPQWKPKSQPKILHFPSSQ